MSNRCAAPPSPRVQSVWLKPAVLHTLLWTNSYLYTAFYYLSSLLLSPIAISIFSFVVVYRTLNIQLKREIPVLFTVLCVSCIYIYLYLYLLQHNPQKQQKPSKGICSYTHWSDIYEALHTAWVSEPRHTQYRQCTENGAGGRIKDSQPPIKERWSTSGLLGVQTTLFLPSRIYNI